MLFALTAGFAEGASACVVAGGLGNGVGVE